MKGPVSLLSEQAPAESLVKRGFLQQVFVELLPNLGVSFDVSFDRGFVLLLADSKLLFENQSFWAFFYPHKKISLEKEE